MRVAINTSGLPMEQRSRAMTWTAYHIAKPVELHVAYAMDQQNSPYTFFDAAAKPFFRSAANAPSAAAQQQCN